MFITKDYLKKRKQKYENLLKAREEKAIEEAIEAKYISEEDKKVLMTTSLKTTYGENKTSNNALKNAINNYHFLVKQTKKPCYLKQGYTRPIYIYNYKSMAYLLLLNEQRHFPMKFTFVWEEEQINKPPYVNYSIEQLAYQTELDYISVIFEDSKRKEDNKTI